MALRHILLGMLAEPASGYDLKRQFNRSLRHFWAADLAQIYPALQKLERDGLLESSMVPPTLGPPRKIYKRKPAGKKELCEWLNDGPEFRRDRISYLAQVFFLNELGNDADARTFLVELRENIAAQLTELREVEHQRQNADPRYPDELADEAFFRQLTLRLGLSRLSATLAWCDESIDRIDQRV